MKKYRFITIYDDGEKHNGRLLYHIMNNKDKGPFGIGNIHWYPPWRQYVLNASPDAVFNKGCLRDIIDFIEKEIPKEIA